MPKGFVQRQAEAYAIAPRGTKKWAHYSQEVVEQWRLIDYPIELVDSALTYLHPKELRKDIKAGRPIKVWCGGAFALDHPLTERVLINPSVQSQRQAAVYQISRALHDYTVHNRLMRGFSPHDELLGALGTRHEFSKWAQYAQWTDDVAMGCYYAHFGKWPEIQHPVIVEPDWDGLMEYLDGERSI